MAKKNLKVAFVHNAFIEYRTPFFNKLSSEHDVRFFFEWFDSTFAKSKPGFVFHFLRSFKISEDYSFSPLLFFYLLNGKYNLFVAGAIGQLNTYVAFFVSRLLRKPFIFWDENWYWTCTKWKLLVWPYMLHTINNSKAIVVPGSKSKDFYLSINPSLKNRIFIAPNVSLLPQNQRIRTKAKEFRRALKLNNKKVVLYCGRLVKQKGFAYLARAFEKVQQCNSNAFLLVIGGQHGYGEIYSNDELGEFRKAIGENNIHFTGWVESSEKAAYFLLADVVVVPSIFFEGGSEVWGFAVNESMSVGKPVVATKAVGASYDLIINGTNGYIVNDKDSEALFRAIKLIIDDPLKQEKMGIQALRILNNGFTYEHMLLFFKKAIKSSIR